jgi:peptidoglycan/LPS O-acetylase OafA/YrhL
MKLISIQYLRALAALSVVVSHLYAPLSRLGYSGYLPGFSAAGVDLFFVISGFIMWVTTCEGGIGPLQFYRKRIVRIVPLYWTVTTLIVVVMLFRPSLLVTSAFDLHHVVMSYLFIPSIHPVLGSVEPVLTQGWTLNYEMFFYVLFGAALALPLRFRLPATLAALCGLALIGIVAMPRDTLSSFYTSSIIVEFGFGLVVGSLFMRGGRISSVWAILLIVAGLGAIPIGEVLFGLAGRVLGGGLPSALLVAGVVYLERNRAVPEWILPLRLGDASYSIYLFHTILLAGLLHFWPRPSAGFQTLNHLAFGLAGLGVTCAGGLILYYLVEKPAVGLLRDRRNRHVGAPSGRPLVGASAGEPGSR